MAHLKISITGLPVKGTLILQSEYLRHWVAENDVNFYRIYGPPYPMNNTSAMDYTFDIVYSQIEYRFLGWITPYFRFEYLKNNGFSLIDKVFRSAHSYVAGLNLKPVSILTLKFEYARIDQRDAKSPVTYNGDFDIFLMSISMSF